MEFTDDEAVVDNGQELLSDFEEEQEKIPDELNDDFIDNSSHSDEDASFYSELANNNAKFPNQTRNSRDAIFECDCSLYETEKVQPGLYDPIGRNLVTFDNFVDLEKSAEKFKKTLKCFGDSKNQFFEAMIYDVMFYKSNCQITDQSTIIEVLGEDFYNELLDIKDKIKLERTLLDITTDILLSMKLLLIVILLLSFSKEETNLGLLSRKKL